MTGWGQGGPLSDQGGHDINYIGLTGALEAMGPPDAPPPVPLNLVGDFGGGAMMLAMGVLAALHEREQSGQGQVVEAAMSDGTLALMALFYAMRDAGHWVDARGANQPQGFAPFYRCYETSDGQYMAVGAVEAKFYAALLDGLGFDPALAADATRPRAVARADAGVRGSLPLAHARRVGGRVRDARDACVTPVLSMIEAPAHPHNATRDCFVDANGHLQVAPPVRFGRTPASIGGPSPEAGADNERVLAEIGSRRRRAGAAAAPTASSDETVGDEGDDMTETCRAAVFLGDHDLRGARVRGARPAAGRRGAAGGGGRPLRQRRRAVRGHRDRARRVGVPGGARTRDRGPRA